MARHQSTSSLTASQALGQRSTTPCRTFPSLSFSLNEPQPHLSLSSVLIDLRPAALLTRTGEKKHRTGFVIVSHRQTTNQNARSCTKYRSSRLRTDTGGSTWILANLCPPGMHGPRTRIRTRAQQDGCSPHTADLGILCVSRLHSADHSHRVNCHRPYEPT